MQNSLRKLYFRFVQQQNYRNKRDDREQEAHKLMGRLDERVIHRVVDDRNRQQRGRASIEQLASCVDKGHAVADCEGPTLTVAVTPHQAFTT